MESNVNTNIVNDEEDEIDLVELFFILIKKWKIIFLTTLVTMVGFFGVYYNFTDYKYEASIKMYVNADSLSISQSISLSTIDASSSLVPIYGEILNTHLVLDKVGNILASKGYEGFDYYNLTDMITYQSLSDTPVFEITVTDTDPKRAIAIANTIADVLPDQIAGIIDGSSARIVDNAMSSEHISRHTASYTILAGLVGAALASIIILISDYFLDDTITKLDALEVYDDIPVIGKVPNSDYDKKDKHHSHYYGQSKNKDTTRSKT